jgi:SAM-dependent methyltransferase
VVRNTHRCEGIEPSPLAARAARERGISVHAAKLEEVDLAPQSLEVVTLHAVIEHLQNPARALLKAHRWLATGGVIAVCTPKYRGPSWWIHGRGWNGYRVGYHLYLFTAATLARTMEAAGFTVLRWPRRSRPLDDILALWGRKVTEESPHDGPPQADASPRNESADVPFRDPEG